MHITIVSNCASKAIKKTRAVVDRYATRISNQAWQSPFTMEALDELHMALKKVATRQTSVACYLNKGRDGMKLHWIVGNKSAYDSLGAYAIETRSRKVVIPNYLRHAALLSKASGLAHDFGKANKKFASKLTSSQIQADSVRHEWISAWLLSDMNGQFNIDTYKQAWLNWKERGCKEVLSSHNNQQWLPVDSINNYYDAMKFCVATHHKLFGHNNTKGSKPPTTHGVDKHIRNDVVDLNDDIKTCTIKNWKLWQTILDDLDNANKKLLKIERCEEYWRGLSIISRACLVLADHEVSSLNRQHKGETDTWANSIRIDGKSNLNQSLTFHLEQVGIYAANNVRMFTGTGLPTISDETREKIEARAVGEKNIKLYGWQDKAFDYLRENTSGGSSLVFNVAGTGAGKTLGNVKILAALRPEELRITAGFNLRTLTLQTRDAYQHNIGLSEKEIGCIVGGTNNIIEKIHGFALDDDEDRVEASQWTVKSDLDASILPDWLNHYHTNDSLEHVQKLLGTPVIVTTMDHLVEAGEPHKQAGHALAMLRISSTDLIIDEADSYDPKSLMAVLRVIEIAAMFGRNVVISSATLSEVIASAIFKAWQSGDKMGVALRSSSQGSVFCVSNGQIKPKKLDTTDFGEAYLNFVEIIALEKKELPAEKIFKIVAPVDCSKEALKTRIIISTKSLHENNHECHGDKKISIGLVRVANVNQCMDMAIALSERGGDCMTDVFVMTYHAREVLARRAWKEKHLDVILNRKPVNLNEDWWTKIEEIKQLVETSKKVNIVFVVVATPVAEVGRDHDYDWAVIEPSSMTSIVQTAGRVNRHRLKVVEKPNIHILNVNFKYIGNKKSGCYQMPGHQFISDGVKTHYEEGETLSVSSMFGMGLDPFESEPKVLDVRVVFGDEKVKFAIEDEKGIRQSISSALLAIDDKKSWINSWLYEHYRLRENQKNSDFIYRFDSIRIQKNSPFENVFNKKIYVNFIDHKDKNVELHEASHTFLSPNMNKINGWLNDLKISQEDKILLGAFSVIGDKENPTITQFGVEFND